jgi:hypothetical protein
MRTLTLLSAVLACAAGGSGAHADPAGAYIQLAALAGD